MKHPHRLFLLLVLAVLTTAGAVHAQARTWGFSKDTVYEWAPGGDSVLLTNSGSTTLMTDSLILEMVRPSGSSYDVIVDIGAVGSTPSQSLWPYSAPRSAWAFSGQIGAGQSLRFTKFRGDINLVPLNKASAVNKGDTVVMRVTFKGSPVTGSDTLMFVSIQNGTTALNSVKLSPTPRSAGGPLYDLRGRRQQTLPEGVRVPFSTVVTNGKN